ncbi:hypothetical protein PARMER_03629 [Parabacteroides merdae ATCC 43184]|nr:hypothetical protein PARMER_03629 [Parabacteroides merdae ATCC 43184]
MGTAIYPSKRYRQTPIQQIDNSPRLMFIYYVYIYKKREAIVVYCPCWMKNWRFSCLRTI